MKQYLIGKEDRVVRGEIHLDGSKSLSNRALIIQALCKDSFEINHCSTSDDVNSMKQLLTSDNDVLDAHHAGTTFRFLCSYLCLQPGEQILTGSERMQQRPIGPLVDALRKLGAKIEYLKDEGYPPLRIGELDLEHYEEKVSVSAGISSQFISSLLLISPCLPNGLELELVGDLVSRPYLEMTLKLMKYFGVEHQWNGARISVKPQSYKAQNIDIEADWSAASYYYIMAAIADEADLILHGLEDDSLQGDRSIADIMSNFGISSAFEKKTVRIKKNQVAKQMLDYNFLNDPDIAQSVAVACAGVGKPGVFTGLKTLKIKETDRINALQKELQKVNVYFSLLPKRFSKKTDGEFYMIEGKASSSDTPPAFDTYKDHRMAMAFAPLALLFSVIINEPDVVSKSYPAYWDDLRTLGFSVKEI